MSAPAPEPPKPNASAAASAPAAPAAETPQPAKPESCHPGAFEDLHKRTKEIFPQLFEGAKFAVNKGLSNHFQISHNIIMTNAKQPSSGYKFGATFVGTKQPSPHEAFPILMSEVSLSGDMLGNIIHQWTEAIRTKAVVQVQQNQWLAQQGQLDYRGKDFTATLTVVNPNLFTGSGMT